MAVTARLVDDSGNTLLALARDASGAVLNEIDLGYPAVRAAATPLSGQDGEYDVTALLGSRPIVAAVTLPSTGIGTLQDTIRGLMHPGRRYWLYVTRDDWVADRRIRVRAATLTMRNGGLPLTAQLGWSAPLPTFQDVTASSQTLSPQMSASGGFKGPFSGPLTSNPGLVPGAAIITVSGTANARPTIDVYGPCTGPLVRVADTGAQMSFSGLTVSAGDYLHIDCQARTITLNNNPNQSVYNTLDSATSQWLWLPPGSPQVVFSPASSSSPCNAVVTWRSNWL